jgi:hypothetical protein
MWHTYRAETLAALSQVEINPIMGSAWLNARLVTE